MNVNLERLPNSRVKLTIEADAAKLEEGLEHAYRTVVKRVAIPGFRKGKAPRRILERYYGQSILYEDALDYLLPQLYQAAVEETNIRPVDEPSIKVNKLDTNEGLSVEISVDVFPDVQLGEYKGLPVEKRVRKVTEADVERELERLRLNNSELVAVDDRDTVQNGDFANIDFKGYLDGQPFSGGAAEGYTLEIGSGQFIPGFEEQLIGMKVGEEKEINVTFPENYHRADLAGKPVTFKVKINNLKVRMLPDLDDDFAKDVSEYETLAELKDKIREDLEANNTLVTRQEMENKLIEQIIANSTIELPQSMIDQQTEYVKRMFHTNLLYSGMTWEMYLDITKKTEEEVNEEMRAEAVQQLKRVLILDAVAEKENISVTDEEVEKEISERIANSADPDKARQNMEARRQDLINQLKVEKTWDFLLDNAVITEVEVEPENQETNSDGE